MRRWFVSLSFSDQVRFGGFLINLVALFFILFQLYCLSNNLKQNFNTNRIAITGQLYQREAEIASDEIRDTSSDLSTIWALVPQVTGPQYATELLQLVTTDQQALKSQNAAELYHSMWHKEVFADRARRENTAQLRKLFTYTQNYFY